MKQTTPFSRRLDAHGDRESTFTTTILVGNLCFKTLPNG
jgi:hypothetical protein